MARQIVVEILGDHSKFSRSLDQAGRDGGRFGNILSGIGQGIGQGVTGAISGAADAAVGFFVNSIDAASQLEQSVGAVESVFGAHAGIITAFGQTAADSFGLSAREVNESGAVLGAMLQGLGFESEESANHVVALQQRAADMAATFGGTTAEAIDAVGSLLRGERDPIEKYGVSINQATIDAELMAQGLGHLEGEERRQAEALVAMDLVMKKTNATQGAFARESDTMAGSQARAQAKFENVSAALGQKLLPIMSAAFGFINDVGIPALMWLIDTLGAVWTKIQPVVSIIMGAWMNAWKTIISIVGTVIGKLGDVIRFVERMPGRIANAARGMWDGITTAFKNALNTIIRAWNNLGFTIGPIDLGPLGRHGPWTIGTPNLPYFHAGGVVPGVPGTDQLAMLQAGERVLPRSRAGSGAGIVINFNGPVFGDDIFIDEFTRKVAMRLRTVGG